MPFIAEAPNRFDRTSGSLLLGVHDRKPENVLQVPTVGSTTGRAAANASAHVTAVLGSMEQSVTKGLFPTLLVVTALSLQVAAHGQPPLPTFPGMEPYNPSRICGKQGVRWNPKKLPPIGCFGLSSGESASGTIADRELVVAVDQKGEAVCTVDGRTVVRSIGHKSNVPNVWGTCENLTFCVDEEGRDCSAGLTEISRNSDRSIFFYIARRVFGRTFVTNQENWEYYERSKSK